MRLQSILKTNVNLIKGAMIAVGILISFDFLRQFVRFLMDGAWPTSIDLNQSLAISLLSLMTFFGTLQISKDNFPLFFQFNMPRKDQFRGNLLTILISAVCLFIVVYLIYPFAIHLFFDNVVPLKEIKFSDHSFLNTGLNWLNKLIELISAGLGGYFITVFIKRFSIKWFVLFVFGLLIILPILMIISMLLLPESIVDAISSFFSSLTMYPLVYFSFNILELLFTGTLIRLMMKRLSIK